MSVSLQARGLATPRLACFTYPHSAPIKRIPSSVSPLCPSLERGGGSEPTKVEWSGPDSITHMTHLHRGRLVYAVRPDVFQHLRRTVSARPRPSSEPLTPRISCRWTCRRSSCNRSPRRLLQLFPSVFSTCNYLSNCKDESVSFIDIVQTTHRQSINHHELAMAPHIQSSGAPEIQWKYNSITSWFVDYKKPELLLLHV